MATCHRLARARRAAKDQFLRYIFHELRVPLNAVTMAVDELGHQAGDPEATTDLASIAASQLDTVSRILNDNLFIARLEVRARRSAAQLARSLRRLALPTTARRPVLWSWSCRPCLCGPSCAARCAASSRW
jgi:signal transduction histidine kinase